MEETAHTTDSADNVRLLTPFIEVYLQCPICKNLSEHQRVKSKVFADRKRDVDLRPMDYIRLVKTIENIHPPLYYMYHCSYCHFTAGSSVYSHPFPDCPVHEEKIRNLILQARDNLPWVSSAINLLSNEVDLIHRDYLIAVKLNLLAILFLEIDPTVKTYNSMNLGRYYLRLGWLLREASTIEPTMCNVNNLLAALTNHWSDSPKDEQTSLVKAAGYLSQAIENNSSYLETPIELIEIIMLVSRINVKLNNFMQARKFLRHGKELARKTMEDIWQQLRNRETAVLLSATEKASMHATVNKLQSCVDHAEEVFDVIYDAWELQERAKINALIQANRELDNTKLLSLILNAGLNQDIAKKIISESKKSKRLGWL